MNVYVVNNCQKSMIFLENKLKLKLKIFCYECNEYTESIETIIFRRYQVHRFSLIVICQKCKELKSCSITDFCHE